MSLLNWHRQTNIQKPPDRRHDTRFRVILVSLSLLTWENDASGWEMKIDWIKKFLTMSLPLSAILAHRLLGLNAMAIRLGSTRTSTVENER